MEENEEKEEKSRRRGKNEEKEEKGRRGEGGERMRRRRRKGEGGNSETDRIRIYRFQLIRELCSHKFSSMET